MSSLHTIARPLPWVAICLLAVLWSFVKDIYLIKINSSPIEPPKVIVKTGIDLFDDNLDGFIASAVNSADKIVGLGTFYRAHIMGYCVGQVAQEKEISTSCTYTYDVVTKLQSAISAGGELGDIGLPIPDLGSAVTILAVLFKTIFALYFLGMLGVACSVCFTLTPAHEYRQVKVLLDAFAFLTLFMASTIGTTFALKLQQIIAAMLQALRITGSYSSLYILITWTAVAVMLVATLLRIIGGYRGAGTVNMQQGPARSPASGISRKPHPSAYNTYGHHECQYPPQQGI